jgi:hypothetical protein
MSLNSEDIKLMSDLLDNKLEHHIGKIELRCQQHSQTIYGVSGNNGLNGELKSLKKRVLRLEIFTAIIQGIVVSILTFKDKIFG